jgi:hypothetical protein
MIGNSGAPLEHLVHPAVCKAVGMTAQSASRPGTYFFSQMGPRWAGSGSEPWGPQPTPWPTAAPGGAGREGGALHRPYSVQVRSPPPLGPGLSVRPPPPHHHRTPCLTPPISAADSPSQTKEDDRNKDNRPITCITDLAPAATEPPCKWTKAGAWCCRGIPGPFLVLLLRGRNNRRLPAVRCVGAGAERREGVLCMAPAYVVCPQAGERSSTQKFGLHQPRLSPDSPSSVTGSSTTATTPRPLACHALDDLHGQDSVRSSDGSDSMYNEGDSDGLGCY